MAYNSRVPEVLLQTKLYVPRLRPNMVPRVKLIERLDQGIQLGHRLTLISAPAGFGKTTLTVEWLNSKAKGGGMKHEKSPGPIQPSAFNRDPSNIAWLSLDEGDSDASRFLTYLVAALQMVWSHVGQGALAMLQSGQAAPAQSILTPMINEIAAQQGACILVLDDYHLIQASEVGGPGPVDGALTFLLDHLPPNLHLVLVTRVDPELPLARLRARGQLTEVRALDLRFSPAEATEFLNQAMGLNLSAGHIEALERRTEGWIAGLQLAALALQGQRSGAGRKDTAAFISSFSGSHFYVLDYLIEEVLEQQPEGYQNFLLQTAILDRLNGSLCDALTGQDDGQTTLEELDHANLFVIPLDDERLWYRYHRLFADLLRQRLRRLHPEQVTALHSRASEWFEQYGRPSDAIRHALAAKDFERAADLAELAWRAMDMSYKSVAWLNWVKALPDELVRARPLLSAGYGWALLDSGKPEAAESRLRDAELWLEAMAKIDEQPWTSSVEMVALDDEECRSLLISLANARAYLCQALGDVPGTVKHARRALDLLLESDYFERGLSAILLGFAYWASGDLDAARKTVADAISNMQMAGKVLHMISFTSYLADILTTQGRLREAARTYQRLLEIVTEKGEPEPQETAVLHFGLSEIYHEQGDAEAARRHFLRAEELGEQPTIPPWYRHWILAQTRMKMAQGDQDRIVEMLSEAEPRYYRHPIPDVRPLAALVAQAWLAQGRPDKAVDWVREQGLSTNDELSFLREFEHVTLARTLIAQYKLDGNEGSIRAATELLDRLLVAAEEGGRGGSAIEILLLQAIALEAQGDTSAALGPLEQALVLAEPEGYVRVFADEGQPLRRILTRFEDEAGGLKEYVHKLLTALGQEEAVPPSASGQGHSSLVDLQLLLEPLSERELEILELVAEGLTNREIAARLYLSPHTVKVHNRNIYDKLDAHSRTQAVAKARELGILTSS